ncbi:hypothetical protein HGRIS_012494 [Hohenbuehelia grisea]|uniref:Uncharacterized protein n=1 Tax=Hohenbuehelia grisea TaxID=104357 RepID=A0ABR3ISE6_9AGAR
MYPVVGTDIRHGAVSLWFSASSHSDVLRRPTHPDGGSQVPISGSTLKSRTILSEIVAGCLPKGYRDYAVQHFPDIYFARPTGSVLEVATTQSISDEASLRYTAPNIGYYLCAISSEYILKPKRAKFGRGTGRLPFQISTSSGLRKHRRINQVDISLPQSRQARVNCRIRNNGGCPPSQ